MLKFNANLMNPHQMKKKLFVLCALMFANIHLFAQQPSINSNLSITWKVLESDYKGTGESLSEVSLTNNSVKPLSATGWTIYFNNGDPRNLDQNPSNLVVKQINGDFFKLSPAHGFKGIAPKGTVTVKVLSRHINNISDYPVGFYLVYDQAPQKHQNIPVRKIYAVDLKAQEKKSAQATYLKGEILNIKSADLPPIFPKPTQFAYQSGSFKLSNSTKIIAGPFKAEAELLQQDLAVLFKNGNQKSNQSATQIELQQVKGLPSEAYHLTISDSKIEIQASTASGIFYGIQSLKTILPPDCWRSPKDEWTLPALHIADQPRFEHRAFLMDIARNFQPKSQILKVIDALALYKINKLHLHFTDDEGWRIQIKDLPELTEIGAQRRHSLDERSALAPAYGSGFTNSKSSGTGYLTRADFIEILKYARDRHIAVIPEYETPGHARAAIKAMDARYHRLIKEGKPEAASKYLLRDLNDQSVYRSVQGFDDNVINPALPSVYNFIEKLIDETVSMYREAKAPLATIHFGGDEVPAGVWEKSPAVAKLLQEDSSVKNVDELWFYYWDRVNKLLKAQNLYLSGWEEIAMKKEIVNGRKKMVLEPRFKDENFHVDVWNNLAGNEDLAYQLANAGYQVVLTNVTNLYIDMAYQKNYQEFGQYWGGFVDIDKPFDFIPLDYYKNQKEDENGEPLDPHHYDQMIRLNETGVKNIVGLQAPLWSEVLTGKAEFEYMFFPKILALAERAWAPNPSWAIETDPKSIQNKYKLDWSAFVTKLGKSELPRLDNYLGGFQYRIPTAGYIVKNGLVHANVIYPGFEIRYTLDGSIPTQKSNLYQAPLAFHSKLQLRVFNLNHRGGRTVAVIR